MAITACLYTSLPDIWIVCSARCAFSAVIGVFETKARAEQAIADLKASLKTANVPLDFVSYEGVVHSFTVPQADKVGNPGMKYNKAADEDSWKRMKALFAEKFGK